MTTLAIKPADTCHHDLLSLGEVMLRLDPGEGRIHTTRNFRVWEGGENSFASSLIYGLLTRKDPQTAVNYGAAHGALAMTTPGDTSMATVKEVQKSSARGSARMVR